MIQSALVKRTALLLAFTIPAVPALADPAAEAAAQPQSETANDPNRMVCKRVEAIGSRLATKRECKTAKEWDAQIAADRRDLDRIQTGRLKNN